MRYLFVFIGYFTGVAGGGVLSKLYTIYGDTAKGTWPVLMIAVGFGLVMLGFHQTKTP